MEDALLPALSELETKVGRKTPERLLAWMRDARGDGVRACDALDAGNRGCAVSDSISAKISHLREEMMWLRGADVRILCQLLRVHEGIEATRWLMEEHAALAGRGSSSSGSLSSLVTVEESGPWMSPGRESPSPTCVQDLSETTEKEPERLQPPLADDGESDQNVQNPKVRDPRPFRSPRCKFGVSWVTDGGHAQASTEPAGDSVGAGLQEPQSQDLDTGLVNSIKTGANTIRQALRRCSRARKEATGVFIFNEQPDEHHTQHVRASSPEEDGSKPSVDVEEALLDFEARRLWEESRDEETFL